MRIRIKLTLVSRRWRMAAIVYESLESLETNGGNTSLQ